MRLPPMIENVKIMYPAIGFLVFSALFIGVVIRVFRMKHPKVEHLENLPLEDEAPRRARHARSH